VSAPRLEIDLDLLGHNARVLVQRLSPLGISVCGVTKATMGSPEVAREFLAAGVPSLGESRIENIENLRQAGITAPITLVRSPMISQADRVVASAEVSLNSEIDVIERLSTSARRQRRRHGIVLMVELGDLREGIMPGELVDTIRTVLDFPGIEVRGIGTNLACQNGVIPDHSNMAELSALATSVEATFGLHLDIVSGGNSANLPWALDPQAEIGRINHLRLGESILLGREPIQRSVLDGLHADAISIVGEVIESKVKPCRPRGTRGQTAFGILDAHRPVGRGGHRVIVALGRQDLDTDGIVAPAGFELLGSSSDHLILDSGASIPEVGTELRFAVNYSALMSSMASPFVARQFVRTGHAEAVPAGDSSYSPSAMSQAGVRTAE
jgi:predicted amino acid racemase